MLGGLNKDDDVHNTGVSGAAWDSKTKDNQGHITVHSSCQAQKVQNAPVR